MPVKMIQKPVFKIMFGPNGPIPLTETQRIFEEEITDFFKSHRTMQEDIIKDSKEPSAGGMEEVISEDHATVSGGEEVSKKTDTRTFDISYKNPITHKMESLHTKTESICTDIKDPSKIYMKTGSPSSIKNVIITPLIIERFDPTLMAQIRDEIVPVEKGRNRVVSEIVPVQQNTKTEIVDANIEQKREQMKTVILREHIIERKLNQQIVAVKQSIKQLKRKTPVEVVIAKLPKKIRRSLLLRLKEKRKDRKVVEMLLMDDVKFLENLKIKIGKISWKKLLKLAKAIKKLTHK